MSDIHIHLKEEIEQYKHKFKQTVYRGVSIDSFNADEMRAIICIMMDMQERDRKMRALDASLLNSLKPGMSYE